MNDIINDFIKNYKFPDFDIESIRKEVLKSPDIIALDNEIKELKAIQAIFKK